MVRFELPVLAARQCVKVAVAAALPLSYLFQPTAFGPRTEITFVVNQTLAQSTGQWCPAVRYAVVKTEDRFV